MAFSNQSCESDYIFFDAGTAVSTMDKNEYTIDNISLSAKLDQRRHSLFDHLMKMAGKFGMKPFPMSGRCRRRCRVTVQRPLCSNINEKYSWSLRFFLGKNIKLRILQEHSREIRPHDSHDYSFIGCTHPTRLKRSSSKNVLWF